MHKKKSMKLFVSAFFMLVVTTSVANAATLQEQFRDENNDLICVYDSHGKNVYVNKGFSGHCSFNVPDSKLENN